jgi:transposase
VSARTDPCGGYRATDIPTATRELKQRGVSVRVGIEAAGYARRFERLLAELGFELWIGDPAVIKTKRV